MSGPVIPASRARVRMTSGVLHVAQRYAGVECSGHEAVPEAVRVDSLRRSDPGLTSEPSHETPRRRLVHATSGLRDEEWARLASSDVGLERPDRGRGQHGNRTCTALAPETQHPVTALDVEVLDVARQRFVDA